MPDSSNVSLVVVLQGENVSKIFLNLNSHPKSLNKIWKGYKVVRKNLKPEKYENKPNFYLVFMQKSFPPKQLY